MDTRNIIVTLKSVTHTKDPIGSEVSLEGTVGATNFFVAERRIPKNTTVFYGEQIAIIPSVKERVEVPIRLTVSERDVAWSDRGSIEQTITIETSTAPQEFSLLVSVTERWWLFLKRTAVFVVTIEAMTVEKRNGGVESGVKKYTHKGVSGNEDYNRYDAVIVRVVAYWNNEFAHDTDPPSILLDPNLVKAMCYQESRVGNDPLAPVDIMQVGHPDDPALRTLRGELSEYWIYHGAVHLLHYDDAGVESVYDSMYWGVRWLYHKAQGITEDNRRFWRPWKEAVKRYGPGTKKYADDVWRIYTNGVKGKGRNTIQLWLLAFVALVGAALWLSGVVVPGKTVITDSFDATLIATVIEHEKDWWEELEVERVQDGARRIVHVSEPPREQSLLSVEFVNIEGRHNPFLEVYGVTHMGHGNFYLYEVSGDHARLVLETPAVDINPDMRWSSEYTHAYGHQYCGEIVHDKKLESAYRDTDGDGIADVQLFGVQVVVCDGDDGAEPEQVEVARTTIERHYRWDNATGVVNEVY